MKQVLEAWNYKIVNKGNDEADIYIDGDIVDAGTEALYKEWFNDNSSISYRTFRNEVLEKNSKTLNVYINSYGGMVYDALAMHDFLVDQRNKGVEVNTKIRGIAASSATLVALAGGNIEMSENSTFMIHNVSSAVWGDVNQVEKVATAMRSLNNQIVNLYIGRTGLSKEEIGDMMDQETHLTAKEAKEKGFIDEVTGSVSFKNKIKPEQFAFKDQSILNFFNKQVKTETMSVDEIKNTVTNTVTEVLNKLGIKKPENKESSLNEQEIINQVVDQIKPLFEDKITSLETSVADEKKAKEDAEAKIVNLEAKIKDQAKQITNLQANEGNPAPDGDPAPGNADKLSEIQKQDFQMENMMREQIGIEALSEEQYLNFITPKKQK